MKNSELSARADKLEKTVKILMRAMSVTCVALGVDLVGLGIFAAVCAGTDMQQNNPEGLLIGCIVFAASAAVFAICFFALFISAKIAAGKLVKIDKVLSEEVGEK